MNSPNFMSRALERFKMAAPNGYVNAEQVVSILQSFNYNESQIKSIVSQITSDIDIDQFQQLLQPIEQEIPSQKLTFDQIYCIQSEFRQALNIQHVEKVKNILNTHQKEIDLVNRIDPQSRQISTYLAIQGQDEDIALQLLKMLCDLGAYINYKDGLKQTVLFYVCRDGRIKLFDYLISQGINITDTDSYGQTPLFYASRENRIEIISRLIKLGSDVTHLDTLSCQTALFYAAIKGNYEACKLLIDAGCPVNHQDSKKKTALYYARQSQRKEVIDLLTTCMQKQKEEVHQKKEESVKGEQKQNNRKKQKEVPKQSYKLLHTDDKGQQRELTNEDFQKFQQQFPDIAQLILNADETIDETMINQSKEDETWEKIAKKLISQIWRSKGAYFFHKPVDQKEYNISDYYDVVKKPMDFGTIKNKLNVNAYKTCREFYTDMMLVFDNCEKYNGTSSAIGAIGVSIRQEFLGLMEQLGLNKYL